MLGVKSAILHCGFHTRCAAGGGMLTISSTSSNLLTLVRQHDGEAWRRFVEIYAPLIYSWSRAADVSAADAGDLTQEVFARVFTALNDFRHDRPHDTLRGWLRAIWRNKLTDHFRQRANRPIAAGGSDAQARIAMSAFEDEPSSVLSDRQALASRAAELVRKEFEPRTWRAFWMMVTQNRNAAEVAAELGMSTGAARQAKYMVLRRLREELSGEFD